MSSSESGEPRSRAIAQELGGPSPRSRRRQGMRAPPIPRPPPPFSPRLQDPWQGSGGAGLKRPALSGRCRPIPALPCTLYFYSPCRQLLSSASWTATGRQGARRPVLGPCGSATPGRRLQARTRAPPRRAPGAGRPGPGPGCCSVAAQSGARSLRGEPRGFKTTANRRGPEGTGGNGVVSGVLSGPGPLQQHLQYSCPIRTAGGRLRRPGRSESSFRTDPSTCPTTLRHLYRLGSV